MRNNPMLKATIFLHVTETGGGYNALFYPASN